MRGVPIHFLGSFLCCSVEALDGSLCVCSRVLPIISRAEIGCGSEPKSQQKPFSHVFRGSGLAGTGSSGVPLFVLTLCAVSVSMISEFLAKQFHRFSLCDAPDEFSCHAAWSSSA